MFEWFVAGGGGLDTDGKFFDNTTLTDAFLECAGTQGDVELFVHGAVGLGTDQTLTNGGCIGGCGF